ncbi:MAG: RHS domain-containing protein [Desulfobacteraceae bacterium]|nr:RHS domain-containing protein [Desulfobacteraceae bacterium]
MTLRAILTLLLFCCFSSLGLASEQVFFYHTDPAGTPLSMTDSTGTVVWKADYKPFGEEYAVTGSAANDKRFVGKEKDEETGLSYFGARYEDARIGRFTAVDPVRAVDPATSKTNEKILLNPQRLNVYAYAFNNPYRFVDPDGREADVLVRPLKQGGYSFKATDNLGSNPISGTFNTGTSININQLPQGDYNVTPRPRVEEPGLLGQVRDYFMGDRNKNAGRPTLSNTDNWNRVQYPDGSIHEGVQIHPGREGTAGGNSLGCLVCTKSTYEQMNRMFQKNYDNGGVKLHVLPR